jgi:hypothetical protein
MSAIGCYLEMSRIRRLRLCGRVAEVEPKINDVASLGEIKLRH